MNKIITIILFVFFLNYFSNADSVPMQRNDINNNTRVDFLKRGVTFLKRDIQTISYTLQAQGCWSTYCGANVAAAPPCPTGSVSSYITTGCARIDGAGTTWLDQTFVNAAGWVCPTSYPRAMVSIRICTVSSAIVPWTAGTNPTQIQMQWANNNLYLTEGTGNFGTNPTVLMPTSTVPVTFNFSASTNSYIANGGFSGILSRGSNTYTTTYGGNQLMPGNTVTPYFNFAFIPNNGQTNAAKFVIQQNNYLNNVINLQMLNMNSQNEISTTYGANNDNYNVFVPACQQNTIILTTCGSGCYTGDPGYYGPVLTCPSDHPYTLNSNIGKLNCDCNVMGYCGEDTKAAEQFSSTTNNNWCCPTGYPYAGCSSLECGTCNPSNSFYVSTW